MNELFRLYTAEHRLIGEESNIYQPSSKRRSRRNVFCVRECIWSNKSKPDCIINSNELGIDLEESINSRIASS
jgi:hypothetical protein